MKWESLADAKILIVDDTTANTKLLERLLAMVGLQNCRSVHDSREALATFRDFQPDLVMLDLAMPYMDGFEVLSLIRAEIPAEDYVPVLVLTAQIASQVIQQALGSGANDLLTKPFHNAEVILRVHNLLETRHFHKVARRSRENLALIVADRTSELSEALQNLKEAQEQVIQQERLKALGILAGGVADAFDNALSAIRSAGEFVRSSCRNAPGMSTAADQMDVLMSTAGDASLIIQRLRTFHSTENTRDEGPVDLATLVREVTTGAVSEAQSKCPGVDIELRSDLQDIPLFWGRAHELREMLINLMANAIDAMPTGGTISLRTGQENDLVFVAVTDSGTGMSESTRRKCVEPFFTTKGDNGSGLGLATVYGIVQRHLGQLEIHSEIGKGSTFTIRFPARFVTPAVKPSPADGTAHPVRILVVEDQEEIREIIVAQISDDLCTIDAASDGQEAVERLTAERYDLVITDQAMPGMNGDQLAAFIKQTYPETRVILLTGFGGAENGEETSRNYDMVLGKPISQAEFRLGIAAVMAARPIQAAGALSTVAHT